MAWEIRDGRHYLYQSYRDPTTGNVRRRYLGRGSAAVLLATKLKERREGRASHQAQTAQERQREASLGALDVMVRDLMGADLLAAGFHQHAGTWRRRMLQRGSTPTFAAGTRAATPPIVPPAAMENSPPKMVSPGRGIRASWMIMSVLELPTTTILFRIG